MKILIKSLFALLTFTLLFSFTTIENDHIGKWKGQDQGEIGFMTLSDDGYATFEFDGQSMGGKSFTQGDVDMAMKYVVNYDVAPVAIDFIIIRNSDDKELNRMEGIIDLKSKNEMEIAVNFGDRTGRPEDFSVDAIVFNRVQ